MSIEKKTLLVVIKFDIILKLDRFQQNIHNVRKMFENTSVNKRYGAFNKLQALVTRTTIASN